MWIAQVSENRITRVKLYPEQATETRFPYISGATLYAYCFGESGKPNELLVRYGLTAENIVKNVKEAIKLK